MSRARPVSWYSAHRAGQLILCLLLSAPAAAQVPGQALSLDGSDDYVSTDRYLGQPAALSIMAWVKLSLSVEGATAIVGNHHSGANWESVELNAGNFVINHTNSNLFRQSAPFIRIDDEQWHHVAAVWDGAELRVYLDGALHAGPVPAVNGPWSSPEPIWIGARHSSLYPPAQNDGKGLIDEVQVWNVARTQAQIVALMHQVLGPEYTASPDSGLVGYWRFEQVLDLGFATPGANDVHDLSVSNGLGDVVGATLVPVTNVSAPPTSTSSGLWLTARPNPFSASTVVVVDAAGKGIAEIAVFDIRGRRIATLLDPSEPHVGRVVWGGTDRFGATVSPGLYFLRAVTGNGQSMTTRVVRIH